MSMTFGALKADRTKIMSRLGSMEIWQRAIVFVYTTWAPSCHRISTYFDSLSAQHSETMSSNSVPDLLFFKVDADQEPELATEWSITAYPTFLWLNANNEVLGDMIGANRTRLQKIVSTLEKHSRDERLQREERAYKPRCFSDA